MEAQTCRRHEKTRAEKTEKHQKHSGEVGIPHSAEDGAARRLSRKAPTKSRQNSKTWGRPRAREKQRDCFGMRGWPPRSSSREEEGDGTQEVLPRTTTTLVVLKASGITPWQSPKDQKEKRAQTADRVVVKYLDRKARAPTANRRSRSGVGGARRGVREYGAVNYHKVALEEQKERRTKKKKGRAVPTAGKRRAVPTAGKRRAVPTAGKRRAVPTAGKRRAVPTAGKRRAVPTAGKEQ